MSDFSFSVNIDIGRLHDVVPELMAVAFGLDEFKLTQAALEDYVEEAHSTYVRYLHGQPIPGHGVIKHPTGKLAGSAYRDKRGLFSWAIGNASDYAKAIEDGAEAYDMKKNLATAPKARMTKDGHRYLIIPFRHGVVGTTRLQAMPRAVYAVAKLMAHSRALGSPATRLSATGWTVPKFTYQWQDRLGSKKGLQAHGLSEVDARRYAGMVRMGKSGQTTYLTFRVMSEKSAPGSWMRPAQPALYPLQTALEVAWTKSEHEIGEALMADIQNGLQRGW